MNICTCNDCFNFVRADKVVKCGRLDDPQNGDVRISGTSIGSKARYTCNVGFERVGQNIRVCKSNGKWSGEAPICRRKSTVHNNYYSCIPIGGYESSPTLTMYDNNPTLLGFPNCDFPIIQLSTAEDSPIQAMAK